MMTNSHKPPFQKHILPNGLTVILVPMQGVQSATVLALVNTGSRYEPEKWAGISHFLEHMVFKGTASYETAQDLAAAVDAVGAEFNAFTSKEYTGYYVKAASTHLPLAVDVVSDMVLTPRLRSEDLEREKGVIVEEINMYLDTPSRNIGNIFEEVMFAGSPLGRDVIGSKETVRALKREDFVAYLKQWYGVHNIVLTIAGDAAAVSRPGLVEEISQAFRKTSDTSERKAKAKSKIPNANFPFQKPRLKIQYKKTDQAHFIMAFPGMKRSDPDRYALAVLAVLFGGNMSSRLFTEVREKRGLCYYVRSDMGFYHETGMFGADAGVDPSRVGEAIKVVRDEFAHLLDTSGARAISAREIQRAKDYFSGKTVLELEDTESVANHYGSKQLLSGKIETHAQELQKIMAVTIEDVRAVARRMVAGTLYFAMIGPFEDEQKFVDLLGGK